MTTQQEEQADHGAEQEPPPPPGPDAEATQPVVASAGEDGQHAAEQGAETEPTGQGRGFPAGQLAAGGLSTAAAVLAGLYQLAGPWGLAAGGVAAGGGALAYVRRRRQGRAGYGTDLTGSRRERRGASRTGVRQTGSMSSGGFGRMGGGLFGSKPVRGRSPLAHSAVSRGEGRSRTRAVRPVRSPGRTSARPPRTSAFLGRSARTGGRAGRTGTGGIGGSASPRGQRRQGRGRGRTAGSGHGARRAAGGAIRATRRGARQVGGVVRATGRGVRRAGSWAGKATGRRASRAFTATGRGARRMGRATGHGARRTGRAIGRGARRAGAWADRRTGRRLSTTWAAARTAPAFGPRAAPGWPPGPGRGAGMRR